jgi:hypothetical protein
VVIWCQKEAGRGAINGIERSFELNSFMDGIYAMIFKEYQLIGGGDLHITSPRS